MEKERGSKLLAIFAICIAVVGMTIGFASFSTLLKIEGEGEVKASNWGVEFENLGAAVPTGTAREATGGTPEITAHAGKNNTKISNYQVELTTPGDSISYTFNIVNKGTYDAEIGSITMAGKGEVPFNVTGTGANKTTDENNVKAKLSYSLAYVGGAKDGQELTAGDELAAGGSVTVKLTLTYQEFTDQTLLPTASVTIDNLGIDINYVQA